MKQSQNALSLANMCEDPETKRKLMNAASRIAGYMDELGLHVSYPRKTPY